MVDIFVFGSNLAGRHGAGSAKEALLRHGAIYGRGIGRQGNSYAIPTKDGRNGANLRDPVQRLSIQEISEHVDRFLYHAREHPEDTFNVVAIGCGLGGYTESQIAPLFKGAPSNVNLPKEFYHARS